VVVALILVAQFGGQYVRHLDSMSVVALMKVVDRPAMLVSILAILVLAAMLVLVGMSIFHGDHAPHLEPNCLHGTGWDSLTSKTLQATIQRMSKGTISQSYYVASPAM